MWILNMTVSFMYIVLFPSMLYSSVMSRYETSSSRESYSVNGPINDNVLSSSAPPSVIEELPLSVTFYANEGKTLRCNIDGKPRPNYQWYRSTNDLSDGSSNVQDQKFEPIENAIDETLLIEGKSTKKIYSKYVYYCVAKNPLGTLLSNKVIVEKMTRPSSISIKHITHPVYVGEKYMVQCQLVPDLVPLFKFKCWEIRTKGKESVCLNHTEGRYSVISSTKLPQLHIRNVTGDDFDYTRIRCIYQSNTEKHDDTVPSSFISIDRNMYEFMPMLYKVMCTGETVTATLGTNIELPWCSVPRTMNVTWYKIDNLDSKKRTQIDNRVNDTKYAMISRRYGNLLIMNLTKDDAGIYLAEQASDRRSARFTLNIYEPPAIYLMPRNIHKNLSQSAEFNCAANFPRNQFVWLHNGLKIVSGFDDGNVEVISSHNTSILKVRYVRLSVSGVYQCIAISSDEMKGLTDYRQISGTLLLSEVAPIRVKQSPRVEKDSQTSHIQMSLEKPMKITCVFAANPRPNIDLYHNSKKVPLTNEIGVSIQQDPDSIYNSIAILTIKLNGMESRQSIAEYAGEYQARATNSLGTASCNTFILMDGNLDIKLLKEQTAIGGLDYLLTCFFVAAGVPEFSWDRKVDKSGSWETLPVNHRTELVDKGYKLLLRSVIKSEDEGVYRCTIKYNQDTKTTDTRLVVAYTPSLQNLPKKHDSSQMQTHICTIRSTADEPWYTWWTFTKYNSNETLIISPKSNNPLFNVYYGNARYTSDKPFPEGVPQFAFQFPNVGVDLIVKARSNDKDSFGKFSCHAKNHIGSDIMSIEDNFLTLEFKNAPPSSSEVVVGNDLYLDCTAKESDLNPVVKWRLIKDSKYVNINDFTKEHNGRIFQYNNGTLVMKSIKETDPSKLVCFIFPAIKSDMIQSKISYIEIRVPARIQKFKSELFKVAQSSFNLSCDVYGHSHGMLISWFQRIKENGWDRLYDACISSSENSCINEYQLNSGKFVPIMEIHNRTYYTVHLEFRESKEDVSGQYKCEAKNKFNIDPDVSSTTLIIIAKPSVVIIDYVQRASTSTSIEFDWKPPQSDGNRPILQYVLSYFEMSPQSSVGEQRNMTQKTVRVNHTVHSIVIDQLRPNKKYSIDISAQNEVGVSEPANILLQTQEAKPERAVNELKASSSKPDEILISWSDPDFEYQNGLINRFQMCYQIIQSPAESKIPLELLKWPDNAVNSNQFSNVKCQETEKRTITVPYLPQFTDFAIRVIAFNSKGASPPSFTKVRTLEDLPQAPPSSVTCEGQHQAIHLTWNPPGRQTINGILVGYAVYYYQPNKYRDESEMKSVIVQGRTNVIIDQLKPHTAYSIQVMASNRKGLGPPSVSVICETKEAKPEPPEMVKAVKINSTCAAVSWLHTKYPNGEIRQYCVVNLDVNVINPKCQPPDMAKRYNMMIVCDVYGRLSTLRVYARNQYDGAARDTSKVEDVNGIISIGGDINVSEGSSVTLPCETLSNLYKNIYWKKDGREINTNEYPNIKILSNMSLVVNSGETSMDRYSRYGTYQCNSDNDAIEYTLVVPESFDGSPRHPIIDETIVTENSIFIRWKSRGTSDIAAPINGFIVEWRNFYTGDSKTITLDGNLRSFYLNNVTCASDFLIQVSSQNGNGKSKFSDSKRLRTLGSVPEIADTNVLLPPKNIEAKSVNFNLLAFGPGQNCSAMYFTIEISRTSLGPNDFSQLSASKNISVYELENKCCYNISGLNPNTQYQYRIYAYNPAGHIGSNHIINTPGIHGGQPGYRQSEENKNLFLNQSWLLMIVLVIVIIFVLIIVIVGVLYILRSKEKKTQCVKTKPPIRRCELNQYRAEKTQNQDDTGSIDSEPSPYAVYQPDADQKIPQIWPTQVPQQSSTSQYNYPEHLYNQIRYDKIQGRPINLDNRHDNYRRANSAECLSSLGNASVAGIADLESPSNIDQNVSQDYFRAPFTHCPDNDEVFQNIRYPDFSTMNKKRLKRENEILNRNNVEESVNLMKNGVMTNSRYYEPTGSQGHYMQQQQKQQRQQLYQTRAVTNPMNFRQQMSVPEPISIYHQQYGYPNNRLRTSSGSGRNHPSSQVAIPNNSGSSAQVSGYGSYYGSRPNNIQPYSTSSGVRRDSDSQNNQYSSYKTGNSNYNQVQRNTVARPSLDRIESPEEGIYTDRVVVV